MSIVVTPCSRWNFEVVFLAVHGAADADLDVLRGSDDLLFDGATERRPVEVLAAEVVTPGVDVRVELDERQRPVLLRNRAQARQRDRVIAADDQRRRAGVEDPRHPAFDRRVGRLNAHRRRVDVAGIDDRQLLERRDLLEIGVGADQRRLVADLARPEARARRYDVPLS